LLLAATGDIHHPMYTGLLEVSIKALPRTPDLFLIAGDVLRPGDPGDYVKISEIVAGLGCPVVAVFGNTEFQEDRPRIREENPDITFLDDETVTLEVDGRSLLVVGSTGSLERPTSWQKRNIPHISDIYRARVETVASLLRRDADLKMLLTHYATTYLTLEGESRSSFPWMGTRRFESVISETRPDLVIHAHSHKGNPSARLDGIDVLNVSLPLNRKVVLHSL
jgi:predicted phosphodiesterase